jgi:hypothetical protein
VKLMRYVTLVDLRHHPCVWGVGPSAAIPHSLGTHPEIRSGFDHSTSIRSISGLTTVVTRNFAHIRRAGLPGPKPHGVLRYKKSSRQVMQNHPRK